MYESLLLDSLYNEFLFTKKKKYVKYYTKLYIIFNNFSNVGNGS